MKKLMMNEPYKLFWMSIPIVLIILFFKTVNHIDIQMHDTYFVIRLFHLNLFFIILLGMLGGLYFMMRNNDLKNWMTISHILITLGIIFFLTIRIYQEEFIAVHQYSIFLLAIFILVQFIFVINFILSILKTKKH